jgi:hypothetical protein
MTQFAPAVPRDRGGKRGLGMQQGDLRCRGIVPWFVELPVYDV